MSEDYNPHIHKLPERVSTWEEACNFRKAYADSNIPVGEALKELQARFPNLEFISVTSMSGPVTAHSIQVYEIDKGGCNDD